jgi:type 1 fimbria pilin
MNKYLYVGIILWGLILPEISLAAGTNSSELTLKGTLIVPPQCTLNSGQKIDVAFPEMGISDVDGVNNIQNVNYNLVCDSTGTDDWVLGLTLVGEATSFDSAALQAQVTGSTSRDLGIKLKLGDDDFTLNTRMEINADNYPVMTAVPVKNPGSTLPEGAFTSTATLVADYE